jgi:hypothetical protein
MCDVYRSKINPSERVQRPRGATMKAARRLQEACSRKDRVSKNPINRAKDQRATNRYPETLKEEGPARVFKKPS